MAGKPLRVLLVDDDPSCREELRQTLSAFPDISVVGEAGDTASAVRLLRSAAVNLVFLDIELGAESGFRLAQYIHKAFPDCLVIFLTGHVNFALEGYEYGPVDFLVKPINLIRLEQALLQVQERQQLSGRDSGDVRIGIQSGNRLEIVDVQKILYLEKRAWKVELVCEGGKTISTRESLQALEPDFLPYGFYRCHQSFLIPIRRIVSIQLDDSKSTYSIQLDGTDAVIPLSRQRLHPLRQLLNERGLEIH